MKRIDWNQLTIDWSTHWLMRPPSYDIMESFNDFWNARGGRDGYFTTDENGNEKPNIYFKEK